MSQVVISEKNIHGLNLLDSLKPVAREYALIWFERTSKEIAQAISSNKSSGGMRRSITLEGDIDENDKPVMLTTAYIVKFRDGTEFMGVAPTARSAHIRGNRLLRNRCCKSAGVYPMLIGEKHHD